MDVTRNAVVNGEPLTDLHSVTPGSSGEPFGLLRYLETAVVARGTELISKPKLETALVRNNTSDQEEHWLVGFHCGIVASEVCLNLVGISNV